MNSASSLPKFLPKSLNPLKTQLLSIPTDPQTYTSLLIQCSKQSIIFNTHTHNAFDKTPHRNLTSKNCSTVHARILKLGLRLVGSLGNALVDLYSKSGDISSTQKAFDCLEEHTKPAWNSILSGHSKWGLPESVISLFALMHQSGSIADQFGFAIVISALARMTDLDRGKIVHSLLMKAGFHSNPFCEGSLIDMYAKCSCIVDARSIFDGIECPDMISWTNMIAGYVRIGKPDEALQLFSRMRCSGGNLDEVTFVTVIAACVNLGRLESARDLFRQMPSPNVVAWNMIISGHSQNGHEDEAFEFFREMRAKGVKPTRSTLGSVLSAAASLTALAEGRRVHSEAIRLGLDSNVFVASSLINMYAKCYLVEEARRVFDVSIERNAVMLNALIGGYLQNGWPEEVVRMFLEMTEFKSELDEFTFVSIFGACSSLKNLELGRQLHGIMIKRNLEGSLFIGNAIVDMYAKCELLCDAMRMFEFIHNRDNVSWNAIIVGHAHNDREEEVMRLFQRMLLEGVEPDEVTFASVISSCSNTQAFEKGLQIHCLSIKYDLNLNFSVGSSLIDMYGKLGELEEGKKIYLKMPEKNVVSRNALIAGHVQNNKEQEALGLFRQMQIEGIKPSRFTFASILSACNGPFRLKMGMQLHCHILKSGILFTDFIEVSLLRMYLKSKSLDDANKLFLEMPESKNLVLWTAMISGHAQNGHSTEALSLFSKMRNDDVRSDEAAFASVLKACADLASLRDGKELHSLIIQSGFNSYEHTSSALVDMYSKCGDVGASFQVFEEMKKIADIISWNSMIIGFAKNGFAEEALALFQQMQEAMIKPDEITFLGVLTACSHAGLVSEGHCFFDLMTKKYDVVPRVDHYACMIDLLGRGGYLREVEEFIRALPFEPDGVIWATLLSACRVHGDELRGKRAAEKLISLEPHSSSPYGQLFSICAASGDWAGAKMVRRAMRERGVRKSPGCSWIEVGKETRLFFAGDRFHHNGLAMYETLSDLNAVIQEDGYAAEHCLRMVGEE